LRGDRTFCRAKRGQSDIYFVFGYLLSCVTLRVAGNELSCVTLRVAGNTTAERRATYSTNHVLVGTISRMAIATVLATTTGASAQRLIF
jgi:hypothetical protein